MDADAGEGLKVVAGMTLSYVASLAGMAFAWHHHRKHARAGEAHREEAPRPGPPEPDEPSGRGPP